MLQKGVLAPGVGGFSERVAIMLACNPDRSPLGHCRDAFASPTLWCWQRVLHYLRSRLSRTIVATPLCAVVVTCEDLAQITSRGPALLLLIELDANRVPAFAQKAHGIQRPSVFRMTKRLLIIEPVGRVVVDTASISMR